MPEIPEMEHYKQLLSEAVIGKQIQNVSIQRAKSINLDAKKFESLLSGEIIEDVSRKAKYLILHLHGGRFLITHMMLDGRIFYGITAQKEELPGKPDAIIDFLDGNSVCFCDLRLGFLHLITGEELNNLSKKLGIEPLSNHFTFITFANLLQGRRGAIKPLLMDQKIVCGIGNAYSNEILFVSGILPDRKIPSLQETELRALWEAIPKVLREGIRNGGYIEEPFASWDKTSGGQNAAFMVYDRGGQPCKVCSTPITQTKLNGRWSYYCIICQR